MSFALGILLMVIGTIIALASIGGFMIGERARAIIVLVIGAVILVAGIVFVA